MYVQQCTDCDICESMIPDYQRYVIYGYEMWRQMRLLNPLMFVCDKENIHCLGFFYTDLLF